jgi:hypothetical protein
VAKLQLTKRRLTVAEPTDEMVEAAAYPIFVGVAKAPWTSREDDEPCPVQPFTKNHARNIARAALRAAFREEQRG